MNELIKSKEMEKFKKEIGQKIKYIRKQNGLTQKEASLELDISRSYITQLESGHQLPSVSILLKIRKAWGCSISYLFSESENPVKEKEINNIEQLIDALDYVTLDDKVIDKELLKRIIKCFFECYE